ncbi:hypothetical protein [Thiorhodococcus minor]|uniref:HEAT repeat domain-containing protein n=1 Tax=Thiorhodococcus minor TaxID=57489 RepID=A0A6M0K651_9GAMM|nr:hypothetical protein [Thiorhodococcus minor]NEV64724.1 hypothetical protein [Thiorhodococcus minor]
MSKNRDEKRRRKKQKTRSRGVARPTMQPRHRQPVAMPSAQTMWRTMHLDFAVQEKLIETTMDVQPFLWKRDASKIRQIEQATDLAAVLDLTPVATGLADYAWLKRMREFGTSAAPAIVTRLQSDDWMRLHRKASAGAQERLIGALRWCGNAGSDALIDCWDTLDDYGRSLACVAIGLLNAHSAADRLWAFFESARSAPTTHWIGPLWGLIDLADARAADALLELVLARVAFYEQYGFLCRAGDQRAVRPLVAAMLDGPEELRADAMWALTGIAHRLGRKRLGEALRGDDGIAETPAETIEMLVDRIFLYSQQDVERHFETFCDRHASSLSSTQGHGPQH